MTWTLRTSCVAACPSLLACRCPSRARAYSLAALRHDSPSKTGRWGPRLATGDTFRRLVSRTLAAALTPMFDEATRPFQYALRTRAAGSTR